MHYLEASPVHRSKMCRKLSQ